MAKCHIDRRLYKIHRFDFLKLYQLGKIENYTLICDESVTQFSEILNKNLVDKKGECQLFDQTFLAFPELKDNEDVFQNIFINMSFSNFIENSSNQKPGTLTNALLSIKNGIELVINGEKIHFLDFYKSNSMSKNACLYYINDKFLEKLEPRLTFGFNKDKLVLPKWYAYSGLALSDAIMLKDIHLKRDEIVVVPDSETPTYCDCVTAISVTYLFETLSSLKDELKELDANIKDSSLSLDELFKTQMDKNNKHCYLAQCLIKEFEAFYRSEDFNRINKEEDENPYIEFNKKHIYSLISRTNELFNKTVGELFIGISELINEYKDFNLILDNYLIENEYPLTKEVYWERFSVTDFPSTVNRFDGEGLMSKEFRYEVFKALQKRIVDGKKEKIEENEEDTDESSTEDEELNIKKQKFLSIQIRLPFMKGVLHSVDLKQFLEEKGIKYIYGLTFNRSGEKLHKYDANKIKVILTESQFKAASFIKKADEYENENGSRFDNFIDKINEYNYSLGIAGYENISWNKANLNYQFLSTIPFNDSSLQNIIKFNNEVIASKLSNENIVQNIISNKKSSTFEDEIFEEYPDFYCSTKRFKDRRREYLKSLKRTMLRMKLSTEGCRKFLSGDLLELLYHCFYHQEAKKPDVEHLEKYEFFAPNTTLTSNTKYLVLRNPHYSRNEIAIMKPFTNKESEHYKYFGHLTGVLMINALSFMADRLGGADYDGDQVIILTDKNRMKYIDFLGENFAKLYPIVKIPSLIASGKVYNYMNKMECLENTFNSRVGLISNFALHSAVENYDSKSLSPDFTETPFFTILSGLEIDSAKKGIKPYLPQRKEIDISKTFIALKKKLDNKIKFSDKDVELIEKFSTKHPIFYLVKYVLDFDDSVDLPTIPSKKLSINKNNINEKYFPRIIATIFVYNLIIKKMRGLRSNATEISDAGLRENIQHILMYKNIHDINFLSQFNIANADAMLDIYCNDQIKFHYLTTKEEKLHYIYQNLGMEKLSSETEDILCDFSNYGCYLLYFVLCHFRLLGLKEQDDYGFLNPLAVKSDDDLYSSIIKDGSLDKLTEDQLLEINTIVYKYILEINELVKHINNNDRLEAKCYEYLSKNIKNIPFDNYLFIKGNADAGVVFTIFSENLLNYLKENEEEK